MAKDRKGRKKLLEAARKHQDVLQAAGLSLSVIDRYEAALKGVDSSAKGPGAAAQVLTKEIEGEVGEIQAAMRKEFPGNKSFLSVFKADEPIPEDSRQVLALGRRMVAVGPEYAQNLIKYAINAATLKHLAGLCDQLEKEIGGADPRQEAERLEETIVEVAGRALKGKPELAAFEKK